MALPLGHALVGVTIARKTNVNPALAAVLANLPDIDYFFGLFFANGNMLAFHRSPLTHSPPFALFVMLIFWAYGNIRRKPYTRKQLIGIGLIILSHWVLDYFVFLPYQFDIHAGKKGFYDFIFSHIIHPEFFYNTGMEIAIYGTLYSIVWKLIFKEPLWPTRRKTVQRK